MQFLENDFEKKKRVFSLASPQTTAFSKTVTTEAKPRVSKPVCSAMIDKI
jgi:hypothetical protein